MESFRLKLRLNLNFTETWTASSCLVITLLRNVVINYLLMLPVQFSCLHFKNKFASQVFWLTVQDLLEKSSKVTLSKYSLSHLWRHRWHFSDRTKNIYLYFSLGLNCLSNDFTLRAVVRVVVLCNFAICCSSTYCLLVVVWICFETYFALVMFHALFLKLLEATIHYVKFCINNHLAVSLNTSVQMVLLLQESHR